MQAPVAHAKSQSRGYAIGWVWFLCVVLALCLRLPFLPDPWSGLASDFHNAFGAFATGGPVRNFHEQGLFAHGGMPYYWRIELADGSVAWDWYAHHPALYMWFSAGLMGLFGTAEWVLRLPPLCASLFALLAVAALIKQVLGRRASAIAALLMAVLPYSAHYGMQPWTEMTLVGTGSMACLHYLRFSAGRRRRDLAQSAVWFLVGGLLDWPAAFWLLPIALHALYLGSHRDRRLRFGLWLLPCASLLAVLAHALHMRLSLPASFAEVDTHATLSNVIAWPADQLTFLKNQVRYQERFVGWPTWAAVAFGLWALLGLETVRRRGAVLLALLLLPGWIYIAAFPGRSNSHDFFGMLSLPGIVGLAALGFGWLEHGIQILGRNLGKNFAALLLFSLSLEAAFRDLDLWSRQRSNQVRELANAAWLAPILADPEAVILTHVGRGMCLAFYSRAQVVHSVNGPEELEAQLANIVRRLDQKRPAYYLLDTQSATLLPRFPELLQRLEQWGPLERHELKSGAYVLVRLPSGSG